MNTVTSFQITCPPYPADTFSSDQKLTIIDRDSYMRLIALLTPEQHAALLDLAHNDQFTAIFARLA